MYCNGGVSPGGHPGGVIVGRQRGACAHGCNLRLPSEELLEGLREADDWEVGGCLRDPSCWGLSASGVVRGLDSSYGC